MVHSFYDFFLAIIFEDHLKCLHWSFMMFTVLASCLTVAVLSTVAVMYFQMQPSCSTHVDPLWAQCLFKWRNPMLEKVPERKTPPSCPVRQLKCPGPDTSFVLGFVRARVYLFLGNLVRAIYSKAYTLSPLYFLFGNYEVHFFPFSFEKKIFFCDGIFS